MRAGVRNARSFRPAEVSDAEKGSAGIGGTTTDDQPDYMREHWHELREQLIASTYLVRTMHAILKSEWYERSGTQRLSMVRPAVHPAGARARIRRTGARACPSPRTAFTHDDVGAQRT